jgi:hypothetical protein
MKVDFPDSPVPEDHEKNINQSVSFSFMHQILQKVTTRQIQEGCNYKAPSRQELVLKRSPGRSREVLMPIYTSSLLVSEDTVD